MYDTANIQFPQDINKEKRFFHTKNSHISRRRNNKPFFIFHFSFFIYYVFTGL